MYTGHSHKPSLSIFEEKKTCGLVWSAANTAAQIDLDWNNKQ